MWGDGGEALQQLVCMATGGSETSALLFWAPIITFIATLAM